MGKCIVLLAATQKYQKAAKETLRLVSLDSSERFNGELELRRVAAKHYGWLIGIF